MAIPFFAFVPGVPPCLRPDFPACELNPVNVAAAPPLPGSAAVSKRTPIPVVDGDDLYVVFTYPFHEADMEGHMSMQRAECAYVSLLQVRERPANLA